MTFKARRQNIDQRSMKLKKKAVYAGLDKCGAFARLYIINKQGSNDTGVPPTRKEWIKILDAIGAEMGEMLLVSLRRQPQFTGDDNPAALSPEELALPHNLQTAWDLFVDLPQIHDDDMPDFLRHIHAAQRILLSRPALRAINKREEGTEPATPDALRVCTTCLIHHYQNCETCFGWGVYVGPFTEDRLIPVSAHNAHTKEFLWATSPCPECGSGPGGMPKGGINPGKTCYQCSHFPLCTYVGSAIKQARSAGKAILAQAAEEDCASFLPRENP